MLKKYKLIGFVNLFNVIPDFVYPVFEFGGDYFFQHGKNDKIEEFEKVRDDICSKIIPLTDNADTTITVESNPVYAFQNDDKTIRYGHVSYMKEYLLTVNTEDCILRKEIKDFFDEVIPKSKIQTISKKKYYHGTGRRKSSVARVRVYENGTGSITINGRDIDEYFGLDTLKLIVRQPLVTSDLTEKVDVVVTVTGGGVSGQAGAIRHGISRALVAMNPETRPALKAAGFMTRDPRMKERKKYGLKAARRAPQFSKR